MKALFCSSILGTCLLLSCTKDAAIQEYDFEIPTSYEFLRSGESSVDYSGQTTRLIMGKELSDALLNPNNSASLLSDMFSNKNNVFSENALNVSSKSLKSKVAVSKDYFSSNATKSAQIKALFEQWIVDQVNEVFPFYNQLAEKGIAGQIADGSSTRYVNEQGIEFNQFFIKSLLGALMTDQMLNNYLSPRVLDADNNRSENDLNITAEGKTYTIMEHKWDEAYGYVFGNSQDGKNPLLTLGSDDVFLNKYLKKVDEDPDFSNIANEVFEAFKIGRAAIVAKDYEVRDLQAKRIQERISTVIAARSVYYLQQGKMDLERDDLGSAFHNLSEAYGFIFSLQFTREPNANAPYFSDVEVDSFLMDLTRGAGFWEINAQSLDAISNAISERFEFSVGEAAEL